MRVIYKQTGFLLAALLVLSLCACGKSPTPVPVTQPTATTQQPTTEATVPKEEIRQIQAVMEPGELYTLDSYPNLERVDLSGSTCYWAILDFMEKHPQLEVVFTVDFGGTAIRSDATAAELPAGSYQFDLLLENLQYLPNLTTLSFPGIELAPAQIEELLTAYPELALDYTVELFGETYGQATTNLNLSYMSGDQVDEAIAKLGLLTNLVGVELGENLSLEDVARLQDAAPRTVFDYSFTLFGKTLSTLDEEVVYKNQTIGNDREAELRQALAVLDSCRRFVLDNCGFDYEVLARIREDFRDGPNLVWRVYFGKDGRYNQLTDDEVLRAVYNVTDDTCGPMRYCEGVKYVDIGHNDQLTDLSFAGYMPELEVLIASEAGVEELPENIGNCKKLTWLELANCRKLTNIDALEGCESLRFLNISYSKVTSLVALDSLPLERFVYLIPRASTKEQNTFVALHDGCRTVFYGYSNPWTPWRYDDNGNTYNAYYKDVVRKAFNYDYLEQFLPKD